MGNNNIHCVSLLCIYCISEACFLVSPLVLGFDPCFDSDYGLSLFNFAYLCYVPAVNLGFLDVPAWAPQWPCLCLGYEEEKQLKTWPKIWTTFCKVCSCKVHASKHSFNVLELSGPTVLPNCNIQMRLAAKSYFLYTTLGTSQRPVTNSMVLLSWY